MDKTYPSRLSQRKARALTIGGRPVGSRETLFLKEYMQNIVDLPYILLPSAANGSTFSCGKDVADVQLLDASGSFHVLHKGDYPGPLH